MQSPREQSGTASEAEPRPRLEPLGAGDGPTAKWCTAGACSALAGLEDDCADVAIVTPPGFWQRPATLAGAIGNEGSVEAYLERIGRVFDELRRVLRNDGTAWLAIGDSAYSGRGGTRDREGRFNRLLDRAGGLGGTVQRKSLLGIPWRIAGLLAARGWTVRAAIQWIRPPMVPNTARDRPARIVEPVFLLAQHRRYRYRAARWSSDPAPDVWLIRTMGRNSVRRDKLALVRRCLRLGDAGPGRTVIDPFAGRGYTLAAAAERKAEAIGIDIDPQMRDWAKKTLAESCSLPLEDELHVDADDAAAQGRVPQPRLAAAG